MYIDSRFCQLYICGDGVVTSDSSAMATFLCDDPDATFKCKLNGKKIHPCVYAYIGCIYTYLYTVIVSMNKCSFLMNSLIFNSKRLRG